MYELPSRTDVSKCVVDRDVVLHKVAPTLDHRRRRPPHRLTAVACTIAAPSGGKRSADSGHRSVRVRRAAAKNPGSCAPPRRSAVRSDARRPARRELAVGVEELGAVHRDDLHGTPDDQRLESLDLAAVTVVQRVEQCRVERAKYVPAGDVVAAVAGAGVLEVDEHDLPVSAAASVFEGAGSPCGEREHRSRIARTPRSAQRDVGRVDADRRHTTLQVLDLERVAAVTGPGAATACNAAYARPKARAASTPLPAAQRVLEVADRARCPRARCRRRVAVEQTRHWRVERLEMLVGLRARLRCAGPFAGTASRSCRRAAARRCGRARR